MSSSRASLRINAVGALLIGASVRDISVHALLSISITRRQSTSSNRPM
jgi:hypothetical protein